MSQRSFHVTPRGVPYVTLSVASAFAELTSVQKLYAHHMLRASYAGVPIIASQISPESLPLLRLFHKLYSSQPLEQFRKQAATAAGVSSDDVTEFIEYSALVYANMGNYMSFGDSKFIPACSKDAFAGIVRSTGGGDMLGEGLLEAVYDLAPSKLTLAYPPVGISSYYSENITPEDAVLANEYLASKKMEAVNTRVWKEADGSLTIRIASAEVKTLAAETFKGRSIALAYGDFKDEMVRVADEIAKAHQFADNATEQRMLDHYVEHFRTGDVNAHIESQKEWVKDVGPVVETNIGFIETYRDPSGVRAEWEGFVAVVNKDQSRKYGELVAKAETFIAMLPWGTGFEKDTFSSPDFTSLEVLGFASSGLPAGINIPNYDSVRQESGFKNVYLANVISAVNLTVKTNHLTDADWALFADSSVPATVVNVGIHELLGHGTGKLLLEREDGTKNFSPDLIDPLSGEPVATWYRPGETFGSVFGGDASSYEECRAEAVSLYLSVQPELLAIFDIATPESQRNVIHVCWLKMVHAGLVGLEMYTPETKQWRQAHMRARYCILQALLRCERPLVKITLDEKEGLLITIDSDRIATDGIKAIGDLLVNLSVNKSIANAARGNAYYADMTTVSDEFVRYREIVLERRKPRRQYTQAVTTLNDHGEVELREFAGSAEGMIESFVARHSEIPL